MQTADSDRDSVNLDEAAPEKPRKLTTEQQHLAASYRPYARQLAKAYKAALPHEWAEIDSAALFALVEAARNFDAGRGVKFATFLRFRVLGEIKSTLARLGRLDSPASQVVPTHFGEMESGDAVIAGCSPESAVDPAPATGHAVDAGDEVGLYLRNLPPKHRRVIEGHYIEGTKLGALAKELGLSKSRVSVLRQEGMEMMNDVHAWRRRTGRC